MPEFSLPCLFESQVSLATRAYYQIGGTARFLAHPATPAELADLLLWNNDHRLPLALMGKGSNILFSDTEFPGIVISLDRMQRMFWLSTDELFCEAGADNTLIAEELLNCGRGDGEWLFRLPGQIGSTVRMNARCFGGEISNITAGILTVSISGELRWQTPDEVFQGYKHTSLMDNHEIVVAVVLRFPQTRPLQDIKHLMQGYEEERTKKHHFDFPSCGSTFKNNYTAGRSSGSIFEELGFKGKHEGGAMVSEHHANFIYNRDGATANDVLRLAAKMRTAAIEQAGIQLDLEVQCIGLFDHELLASCGISYTRDPHNPSKGWTGLLWHPTDDPDTPLFPRILLHGPLVGYNGLDREFPSGAFIKVEQLLHLKDAIANPESPFLRWTTTQSNNSTLFSIKSPSALPAGTFIDGLWQYGVSELFIAHNESCSGYLEFEITPEGNWVALRFDGPRTRANGYEVLSAEPWKKDLRMVHGEGYFGMEFSYKLLQPFMHNEILELQCCASSGRGEYGLFPWWEPSSAPADFHQPAHFYHIRLL
ncbi:MAG: UDP-N-acetylmuramate dehydrogenase [Chlorobiales bacterium]|nr:UDP-N-acetylmuramate dehydrogenase [Chlorobiales bacterium]